MPNSPPIWASAWLRSASAGGANNTQADSSAPAAAVLRAVNCWMGPVHGSCWLPTEQRAVHRELTLALESLARLSTPLNGEITTPHAPRLCAILSRYGSRQAYRQKTSPALASSYRASDACRHLKAHNFQRLISFSISLLKYRNPSTLSDLAAAAWGCTQSAQEGRVCSLRQPCALWSFCTFAVASLLSPALKMGHADIWNSHPAGYGKGSRKW